MKLNFKDKKGVENLLSTVAIVALVAIFALTIYTTSYVNGGTNVFITGAASQKAEAQNIQLLDEKNCSGPNPDKGCRGLAKAQEQFQKQSDTVTVRYAVGYPSIVSTGTVFEDYTADLGTGQNCELWDTATSSGTFISYDYGHRNVPSTSAGIMLSDAPLAGFSSCTISTVEELAKKSSCPIQSNSAPFGQPQLVKGGTMECIPKVSDTITVHAVASKEFTGSSVVLDNIEEVTPYSCSVNRQSGTISLPYYDISDRTGTGSITGTVDNKLAADRPVYRSGLNNCVVTEKASVQKASGCADIGASGFPAEVDYLTMECEKGPVPPKLMSLYYDGPEGPVQTGDVISLPVTGSTISHPCEIDGKSTQYFRNDVTINGNIVKIYTEAPTRDYLVCTVQSSSFKAAVDFRCDSITRDSQGMVNGVEISCDFRHN